MSGSENEVGAGTSQNVTLEGEEKNEFVGYMSGEERCVCCGAVIPEGRMVCPDCWSRYFG